MTSPRKLAAILAADVVGYSRLAGADEERVLARLRSLRSDLIEIATEPRRIGAAGPPSALHLLLAQLVGQVISLADRQRDDRQGRVLGAAGRELTAVGHEEVGDVVRL